MSRRIRASLVLGAGLGMVLLFTGWAQGKDLYTGKSLVRLARGAATEIELRDDELIVSHEGAPFVEVVLSAARIEEFEKSGVSFEVVTRHLGDRIEAERARVKAFAEESSQRSESDGELARVLNWGAWFDDFQSGKAVDAYLDTLQALAPERAAVRTVGQSSGKRSIRAIVFDPGEGEQDSIVVLGTQHAREWISPMVVSCLADVLARRYDTDDDVRYILDRVEVALIPMVNPDGYAYSRSTDRMWRKNRNGSGVDLNRNWDIGWDITQAGPSSETYPGTSGFSEVETQAVRTFIEGMPQLKLFLDYHSPAQAITYPYAFTSTPPDNIDLITTWATEMAETTTSVNGVSHGTRRTGMGGPVGGLAHDWAANKLGVVALTPEIRAGDEFSGFGMAPEDIVPTCEESYQAFLVVAKHVADGADDPILSGTGGSQGTGGDGASSGGQGTTGTPMGGGDSVNGGGAATSTGGETSRVATDGVEENAVGPEDTPGCSCRVGPGALQRGGGIASSTWFFSLLGLLGLARFSRRMKNYSDNAVRKGAPVSPT